MRLSLCYLLNWNNLSLDLCCSFWCPIFSYLVKFTTWNIFDNRHNVKVDTWPNHFFLIIIVIIILIRLWFYEFLISKYDNWIIIILLRFFLLNNNRLWSKCCLGLILLFIIRNQRGYNLLIIVNVHYNILYYDMNSNLFQFYVIWIIITMVWGFISEARKRLNYVKIYLHA